MRGRREISLPKVDKNIYQKMWLSHTGTVSLFLLYIWTKNKRRYKRYLMKIWELSTAALRGSIKKKLEEKPMTVRQLSDSIGYNYMNIHQALYLMRRKGDVDRRPLTSAESTHFYPNTRWIWYLKE